MRQEINSTHRKPKTCASETQPTIHPTCNVLWSNPRLCS